jgi:hypothetical protein
MFYELHVVVPRTTPKSLGATLMVSLVHIFEYMVNRSLLHFHQNTFRETQNNASRTTYHPLPPDS